MIFESMEQLPDDFFDGCWRLDLCDDDYVLPRILNSILEFTQQDDNILPTLVCDDSVDLECRSGLDQFVLPAGVSLDDIRDHVRKFCPKLNTSQFHAVMASFQHRLLLVQGPPGTGKTTTASNIVAMHRCLTGGCLVCAASNVAVDTIAGALKTLDEPFVRFGTDVTPDYCEVLKEHCPEVLKIEELKSQNYTPNGAAWKKHIKNAITNALSDNSTTTVVTLGSASSERASMNTRSYRFFFT